jgi:Asp-tRNA(Asn)/Glu-tRNA(Gln) amidotransferase A subunit family amidase
MSPPSPYEALQIASQLLNADGCKVFAEPLHTFEWLDPGAWQLRFYMRLPRVFRKLHYLWVRYILRDPLWAGLLQDFGPKTALENWRLVARREAYKSRWHDWWSAQDIDILLTAPNATPALPHDAMKDAVGSCGYTFLFNLLDYSAGIMPITKVDAIRDVLPAGFKLNKLNGVARGAYKFYDPVKMAGLPVGVQVVGRRLEEEKVLGVMGRIESMLDKRGEKYELLNIVD